MLVDWVAGWRGMRTLEYDSPPIALAGKGRLDSPGLPIMYGSQDIDICIHECRATTDDDIYVATLEPQRDLRLLDLTHVLEEDVSEFESLDLAIHMLFLARSHSYGISREIALEAKNKGFDGIIYPSFFSLIRTGGHPFETAYGLSLRRFHPEKEKYAEAYTIPNFALFGRPLDVAACNRNGLDLQSSHFSTGINCVYPSQQTGIICE
ncbi:RES family NAD+ phosphorylase [Pseudomonas savastanoi]|uniref:RES family NAD+ phosphorylase n=1 Tax=Pseudomonas savastanoi TaxID=29438 RepID=UPI000E31B91A|nr:RES family NAD+ phosphorylase [Pseudomonas savastanoi]